MKTTHKHRAVPKQSKIVGFSHCVRPDDCHPAAHGGVTHIDHCRCGATRRTNSTGFGRTERGPWTV
jgi:hypothetical protein